MKGIWKYFLLVCTVQANAQMNLVNNWSFEDTVQCPTGLTQIDFAVGWSSYRGTPDYFNSCAANTVSVPQNSCGFQYSYEGNAYALIILYTSFQANIREYIGTQLSQPLTIGTKYFLTSRISRSDSPVTNGISNNFGFRFSTVSYSITNPAPLDNFCHYSDTSLTTDSAGWTKISGSFVADSSYEYLIIGNFFDDQHTDTLDINGHDADYYVDAICVSTDSLQCELVNGITPSEHLSNATFPNPSNDNLMIQNSSHAKCFMILDLPGHAVMTGQLVNGLNRINTSSIVAGMYLVFLDHTFYSKIIVQH